MLLSKPADLDRAIVAGGSRPSPSALPQILAKEGDDVAASFPGIWDRMLNDAAVSSAIDILIESVLSDGIEVVPAVNRPPSHAPDPVQERDAELAEEMAALVRRSFDRLSDGDLGLLDLSGELLMGLCYGHKAAEIILELGTGQDQGRLVLAKVNPLDPSRYAFIVDAFGRTAGLQVREPGSAGVDPSFGQEVSSGKPESLKGFLPRSKFVIFRNAGKNGDPRGETILRAAYKAYLMAEKAFPEWFRYLSLFTLPLIVANAPPNAGFEPELDENGQVIQDGRMISVATKIRDTLVQLQNGTVAVLPFGTEKDFFNAQGTGEAFIAALDKIERLIHLAILGTTRVSLEAAHGSKADSSEAQNVLKLKVNWVRRMLEATLRRDLAKLLIRVNYGEDFLHLTPFVVLSKGEARDKASMLSAFSQALTAKLLRPEQLPAVWAELGLPPGDMDALFAELEEAQYQRRLAAGEESRLRVPGELPEDDLA